MQQKELAEVIFATTLSLDYLFISSIAVQQKKVLITQQKKLSP
jgi:hypothetical protein